jgi:hypothetical protein
MVGEVDGYKTPREADRKLNIPFLDREGVWDYPAAVITAHERREGSRPVEVVELEESDPWRIIYAAALGLMPNELDEFLCMRASLTSLGVNDIIEVQRVQTTGSLEDLLARLTNFERITPRQFSNLYLASGSNPNTGYMGGDTAIPNRWERATAAGPNVVVVTTADSLDDFALLWNLRAQWGDRRAMPIGVPREELDQIALTRLHQPGTTTFFGLGGGHIYLVSETVSTDELQELAAQKPAIEVATSSELLRLGTAPSRHSDQVQVWAAGRARINPFTDSDLKVLSATAHRPPSLNLSVRVPDWPMPTVGPLRASQFFSYHAGAAQVQAPSNGKGGTVEVPWPTKWTMLSASALAVGFEVRESQPGIAAMNLIRAIGDTSEIRYLADGNLIDLLYELAERSGMSWWKDRWNRVESRLRDDGKTDEQVEVVAQEMGRDDPVIAAAGEGRQLAFSKFQGCFADRAATDRWLSWATRRQLIVKGVELKCSHCNVPFWLPVQQMSPPHTCPGCGHSIEEPFRNDGVNFKYRIGEPLRRSLEVDSLGHVLALRWLVELFDRYGLVGAHPGVEFIRDGKVVAEADVVLLFSDGSMVPVEVKRRARAMGDDAIKQLEAVSTALGSPFDVMCIVEPDDVCDEAKKYKRAVPERPRFLLTLDQLAWRHVIWSMGANPFEKEAGAPKDAKDRRSSWISDIRGIGSAPFDIAESALEGWREKFRENGTLG